MKTVLTEVFECLKLKEKNIHVSSAASEGDIKPFPDPLPGSDGHYLSFSDVYGSQTSEEHRPTLRKKSSKQKTLPFHGKLQHVKNANITTECEECGNWFMLERS